MPKSMAQDLVGVRVFVPAPHPPIASQLYGISGLVNVSSSATGGGSSKSKRKGETSYHANRYGAMI